MLPTFFVIGAAKSGTTSLHYYLDQHPDVHMSKEKEPNYFSFAHLPDGPKHVIRDRAAYESLFDSSAPVRGEASVTYSFWPHPPGVAERIHAAVPDAKFIYVVRDPVERTLSHYRHRVVLGEERRSLAEVVENPDEPTERYIAASSYATQLSQYLALFPLERFLVIDQADLRSDRDAVLRECFDFLGVSAFVSAAWDRRLNETEGQRQYTPVADRVRLSGPYRRTIGWFSPEVRAAILAPVRRALTRPVVVDDEVTDEIRAHYARLLAPEAERLRALTGKSFSSWTV